MAPLAFHETDYLLTFGNSSRLRALVVSPRRVSESRTWEATLRLRFRSTRPGACMASPGKISDLLVTFL